MIIMRLISSMLFGSAWGLLATGEPLAGLGVTAILAAAIYWLVRGDRQLTREGIEAMGRSAKASERLTAKLEKRPCLVEGPEENTTAIDALRDEIRQGKER